MAWGKINLTAGGGTTYNYKITAYASSGDIPSSDTANAIAVVTSTAIPAIDSGGIIFKNGSTAPTVRTNGSALQTGDIWFSGGAQSSINFVGVNGIILNGNSCYQYTGSAWVVREAYIRISGAWVLWQFSLYRYGNEQTPITGGWQARGQLLEGGVARLPTLTKAADRLSITHSAAGNNYAGVVEVANNIDVTFAKKLKIELAHLVGGHAMYLAVTSRSAADYYTNAAVAYKSGSALTRQVIELNVEALSGVYNIAGGIKLVGSYGTSDTLEIYDVHLD